MTTTTTTNYGIPIPPLAATGTADGYGTLMEAADAAIKSAIDGVGTVSSAELEIRLGGASAPDATEISYVNGVTSALQSQLSLKLPTSYLSINGALSEDSDVLIPSQKAVKTYCDGISGAIAGMTFKGVIDCSASPNYPAAVSGDTYRVSVAGKIGGASGTVVEIGDLILCITDNAGGTQAAVGTSWTVAQQNVDGAVTGPISATDGNFAVYNGITGKIVKDGGTIGSLVNAASAKTSAVDADMLPLMDSQAANVVKKLSWAYVKSILKTYFDTVYVGTETDPVVGAITGIVKANGAGAISAAGAGTDYVAPSGALGTPSSGTLTNCTGLPIVGGGTGQTTAQAAINVLTAVSLATNEHILTKDTFTGNAMFKPATGGSTSATNDVTDTTLYPLLAADPTGAIAFKTTASKLSFNSVTGMLTATGLTGPLTGNVSGTAANVTGTVAVANGGTGQTTAQTAINALTAVSGATNEYVLTKDTATGNATFKAAAVAAESSLVSTTSPVTVVVANNRRTYIQTTTSIEYDLPTGNLAAYIATNRDPLRYTFAKTTSSTLTVDPGAGNYIAGGGASKKISNANADETWSTLTLQLISSVTYSETISHNSWVIIGAHGTWDMEA